jgi:hypothetical protein
MLPVKAALSDVTEEKPFVVSGDCMLTLQKKDGRIEFVAKNKVTKTGQGFSVSCDKKDIARVNEANFGAVDTSGEHSISDCIIVDQLGSVMQVEKNPDGKHLIYRKF